MLRTWNAKMRSLEQQQMMQEVQECEGRLASLCVPPKPEIERIAHQEASLRREAAPHRPAVIQIAVAAEKGDAPLGGPP